MFTPEKQVRMSCLFCQIIRGDLPVKKIFENEECIALYDIAPQAPVHLLIIPKQHIESIETMPSEDMPLIGRMVAVAKELAAREGLSARGYRLVVNTHEDGGQTVFHLHLHLLGGRRLHWPPG